MQKLTLAGYVKQRNGVALGATGSMRNMLMRSFGAANFAIFWQYWNPIWGYYLSKYVYQPCLKVLPRSLAVIVTFAISGALHDVAASLAAGRIISFFTLWFMLMGLVVVATRGLNISLQHNHVVLRVLCNAGIIVVSYVVSRQLHQQIFMMLL